MATRTNVVKLAMRARTVGPRSFATSSSSKRAAATAESSVNHADAAKREGTKNTLRQGANRNPELYVLAFIMTGAATLVGVHFTRKPTSASSEQTVAMIPDSKPWQTDHGGKYEYHPGGDTSKAKKVGPSALHSTIVRNVSLPKHLHEQFNKYGKEEFDDY